MKNPNTLVVLADSARARLFTTDVRPGQAGRPTLVLEETQTLLHPENRLRPHERYTDSRPGTRAPLGGKGHGVDDRRDANAEEAERRFARETNEALTSAAARLSCPVVLIVAPPRMLGHLRADPPKSKARIEYVSLDLSKRSATEALEHLQSHGHLAAPPS